MKRVMCLYRVSTKGQVDPQDDIPMQRRECQDFINRQSDWKFAGELMEKGVSGYKISAQKRDAIQEMRAMAERKEFDVLLVFMFDRLGRREDETPFLVQWYNNEATGAKRGWPSRRFPKGQAAGVKVYRTWNRSLEYQRRSAAYRQPGR